MAHPQTPVSGNESVQLEDASTQTTDRNSFVLVNTRDASTQTPEDDLRLFEQPRVTSETSEESGKKKIPSVQAITHGSHLCKLTKTDTCRMGDEFDSSSNVLPVYTGNTEIINTEQNVASNKNISQKEKAPREKPDTDVSKVKDVCSVDDMLAASDTSRCLENKSHSKSSLKKLQNASPLKHKPPVETEQNQPRCLACQKTISKHVEVHYGKDLYGCCRCSSTYDNFNHLQMHISDGHFKPFYCNLCQLRYSEKRSHGRRGKCNFCNRNFECNYQLNEHFILLHKDFLETYCRICTKKLDGHSTLSKEVKKKYQCCVIECEIWTNSTICLSEHLNKHFPLKLFKCEVCGNHFTQNSDLKEHLQNIHPLCKLCKKRFVNIYFFNDHGSEQHEVE